MGRVGLSESWSNPNNRQSVCGSHLSSITHLAGFNDGLIWFWWATLGSKRLQQRLRDWLRLWTAVLISREGFVKLCTSTLVKLVKLTFTNSLLELCNFIYRSIIWSIIWLCSVKSLKLNRVVHVQSDVNVQIKMVDWFAFEWTMACVIIYCGTAFRVVWLVWSCIVSPSRVHTCSGCLAIVM